MRAIRIALLGPISILCVVGSLSAQVLNMGGQIEP